MSAAGLEGLLLLLLFDVLLFDGGLLGVLTGRLTGRLAGDVVGGRDKIGLGSLCCLGGMGIGGMDIGIETGIDTGKDTGSDMAGKSSSRGKGAKGLGPMPGPIPVSPLLLRDEVLMAGLPSLLAGGELLS